MKFLISIFALCMLCGAAQARVGVMPINPGDGTYKTVSVMSHEQCSAICRADDQCRGAVTYQPDVRYPQSQCALNNGLSKTSPFEVKRPEPFDLGRAVYEFNQYRARHGLDPVNLNPKLMKASARHANDLAVHGMAAHEGSDGSTHADRVKLEGYNYALIAENVATGQEDWEAVFKAWQDSPGHNENLLRPDVTDFGIALVFEPTTKYITYWAMLVGTPQPAITY